MLKNRVLGAPVVWTIGPAGGAQDEWPARIVTEPEFGIDDRGRQGLVATIITKQKNLAGDEFLGERTVQVRYLFDRTHRVPELDGTKAEPMSVDALIAARQASVKEFLANRTANTNVTALLANLLED